MQAGQDAEVQPGVLEGKARGEPEARRAHHPGAAVTGLAGHRHLGVPGEPKEEGARLHAGASGGIWIHHQPARRALHAVEVL